MGALIGHAVAVLEVAGAQAALSRLDAMPDGLVATHQPYWVARAHGLERGGETSGAIPAYGRAIGLTEDAASRRFLARRQARIAS